MKHTKLALCAAVLTGGVLIAGPLSPASGAPANPAKSPAGPVAESVTTGAPVSVPPGGHGLATVTCPSGKIVSGGGGSTSGFDIEFTDSYPSGNGWLIRGTNHGSSTQQLTARVVCLGLS